mgnify:CR=1 FL=1
MAEKNIAGRVLLYVFIGFTILTCFGLWLDKHMGWEKERTIKNMRIEEC